MPYPLKRSFLALLALILLSGFVQVPAAGAQVAKVHAILFYSPYCGHCHHVIQEVLPPLYEQYGDQLQLIGVNTASPDGAELFEAAVIRFQIPPERQAVPMLIIGETILLGSLEIPEELPGLIEGYLAQGGTGWPDIPGLREALESAQAEASSTPAPEPTPDQAQTELPETTSQPEATRPEATLPETTQPQSSPTSSPTAPAPSGIILPDDAEPGLDDRLRRDPVGNTLAIIVLAGMIISLAGSLIYLRQDPALSYLPRPSPWIPVLCLIGIVVAAYLSYVETAHVEAVCGPVGDCNTVQQSKYARLFEVLPVGVLGLAGYVAILAAWLLSRFGSERTAYLASLALLGMTIFGVLFSIYLTFLEPFVIGATCAWCLTSAVIMTLLLWLSLTPGKLAFYHFTFGEKHGYRKTGTQSIIESK